MKNALLWGVTPCGPCKNPDVSEEPSTSIIKVTRIGEVGTALAVTYNGRTLRRNTEHLNGVHSTLVWINEELLERKVAALV
jgi:hypothetical protein